MPCESSIEESGRVTALRPMVSADLTGINPLLVRAFTQARREEGYARPEMPLCRMEFLRFYGEDTPSACWVAEEDQRLVGAVFGHAWGGTGWIGPLAVSPECQHRGQGQALMAAALHSLHTAGCVCIGLETSPRSHRNIAFYSRLGLVAGPLMCDMAWTRQERRSAKNEVPLSRFSQTPGHFSARVPNLLTRLAVPADYLHVCRHLQAWSFGESYLHAEVELFASVQHAMISSCEMRSVSRVLALAACAEIVLDDLLSFLRAIAEEAHSDYLMLRVPAHDREMITGLVARGWRIVQTHIRMYADNAAEPRVQQGIHLNKWD